MDFVNLKSVTIQFLPIILISFVTIFVYYLNKRKLTVQKGSKPLVRSKSWTSDGEVEHESVTDDGQLTPALGKVEHIPFPGATVTLNGGAKRFYEIVNNRRSVRKYSSKEVPFDVIEECVKAAGTAPSGAHTEPWTFCVVSDSDTKADIRTIIESEEYLNYSQRMARQWTVDLKPLKTCHVKEYLTDAPYVILIFKQIHGIRTDGKKKQHYYNEISVSIAAGILLCALQAAGLSSLVTTPLNCGPALRTLLNRPSNEKLMLLMPVGYAAEDCTVPNLPRKDISEILVRF